MASQQQTTVKLVDGKEVKTKVETDKQTMTKLVDGKEVKVKE